MGNLLINLPNLGYCSILQKIDHMDKYLRYFYPSYGNGIREITAEPQDVQRTATHTYFQSSRVSLRL